MNRLEDYLLPENLREKKKSLEDSIEDHLAFPKASEMFPGQSVGEIKSEAERMFPKVHFTGSPLKQSLQVLEDEIRQDVQIDLDRRLENMANFDSKNSHQIDVIIDDGGISGQNLTEDEIEKLEREILLEDIMQSDQEDGLYEEVTDWSEMGNSNESAIEFPDYLLNDSEIVGYPDEQMQREIYRWVAMKFDSFSTVKDFGCGRGDFIQTLPQLEEDNIIVGIDYIGIDSNPNLIAVGRQKYKDINLICDDFLNVNEQTDYTICIGTLNDDHGFPKWNYFNKTLNHALSNTNKAVIFVLSANNDGLDGFLDYPIDEMVCEVGNDRLFEIDYTKFKDIYLLTVHIGGYDEVE